MAWKTVRRFCNITLIIAAIAAGGCLVYIQAGHAKLLSVQSGSMVPAINKGDLVVVKRVPDKLAVGDVITFINPFNAKQTVTHRVVEAPSAANGNRITTKGDANSVADAPITPSQIVGKVEHSVPVLGRASDTLRHPAGLLALIYIPALLIIIDETRRLSAHYKTQQTYRLWSRRKKEEDEPGLPHQIVTKGGTAVVLCVLMCSAVVLPVFAELTNTATLTGSTIQATAPVGAASGIVIKKLVLRCSKDDTETASRRPKIILYNPTKQDIQMGGWYISDNSGRLVTLPAGTHLKPRHSYHITPLLRSTGLFGLQYAGDSMTLHKNNGAVVDGLSWGSDTSRLDPALQDVTAGTRMQRFRPRINPDTNTAEDWDTWQRGCPHRHHNNKHHHDHFRHSHSRHHYEQQEDTTDEAPAPNEPTQENDCSFSWHAPRWDD